MEAPLSYRLIVTAAVITWSFTVGQEVSNTPVLSPEQASIDVSVGSDFVLKCSGNRRVEWAFPLEEQRAIDKTSIEEIVLPDNFMSTLTVRKATAKDTGRYFCKYLDSVREPGSADGVRSIYVFVNDPNQLYVKPIEDLPGSPVFFTMKENEPSVVGCLPTYSGATVQLLNPAGRPSSPPDVAFDPTVGFTIQFPNVFFHGTFVCRFVVQTGGITKTSNFEVELYYLADHEPPRPVIDTQKARHVVAGRELTLSCNVTVESNALIQLDWTVPSLSTLSRRTIQQGKEDRTSENAYRYQRIYSVLRVQNVDEDADRGYYNCTSVVLSNERKKSSTSVYIKPFPVGIESHVSIMAPKPKVESVKGGVAQLYVEAMGYPDPRVTWSKVGRDINYYGRISSVANHNQTGIRIVAVTGDDAGNYTATAISGQDRAQVNVTLIVNESPIVEIISSKPKPFYMKDTKVDFQCNVVGFPAPQVGLWWQPCSRTCLEGGSDPNQWKALPAETYSVVTDISGRMTSLKYSTVIHGISRYLKCTAENSFSGEKRNAKQEQRILITDVEEGFQSTMTPSSPVQHETVTLTCKANIYEYRNIRWERQSPRSIGSFEPVRQTLGIRLTGGTESDLYSHVATLIIERVQKDFEGQYRCAADRFSSADIRRSTAFVLRVTDATPPLFKPQVLDDVDEKQVDYQGRLELDCEASGLPGPEYIWFKDEKPLITSGAITLEKTGSRLVNAKMTQDDQGNYRCVAENPVGHIFKTWKVTGGVSAAERKKVIGIVSGVVGALFVLLIPLGIFIMIKWRKQKKRIRDLEYLEGMLNNDTANISLIDPNVPLTEQISLLPYYDKWEFPVEKLKLTNKVLGTGQFGKVVKAQAYDLDGQSGPTIVAVKMLKETADIVQRKSLLGEIKIMMHIGQNLNVVNLLGAVTKNMSKGELYMLMEYCANGSLRDYLQRHQGQRFVNQVDVIEGVLLPLTDDQQDELERKQIELKKQKDKDFDGRILTTRDLICYAFQISRGMDYLASHHVIHRDLAARNVLVAEDNVVKICDFGLARQEYAEYIKKNQAELPIKWMAIECIYESTFSTESDVWSFGIVLWELFTLGSTPYPGLNIDSDFVERVKNGYRMERPYLAPKQMYEIMRHCWEPSPKRRPTFLALSEQLGGLLDFSLRKKYVDLNIPYEAFNDSHDIESGYLNDPLNRESKPFSNTDGAADNSNYLHTYKVLPSQAPTKPRRSIRPTDAHTGSNTIELQPMLKYASKSPSPNPSRPGNLIENEDYLNDQFVSLPVHRGLNNNASADYMPSFSDGSSGFHSDLQDDISSPTTRTNYLFGPQLRKGPFSSEV